MLNVSAPPAKNIITTALYSVESVGGDSDGGGRGVSFGKGSPNVLNSAVIAMACCAACKRLPGGEFATADSTVAFDLGLRRPPVRSTSSSDSVAATFPVGL